ncbi:serine/threonine-protein kinase [Actinomadura sp. 21ATH]|uniref:serine/threonine-protein kinase n=1 Tax=Actinomadura sp. 21ATH TaxID=1735444 RepID=UPI0035BF7913
MEPLRPGDPARVGAYRLVARLGSGGMGRVFLGVSPAGRSVAVKVVHAALAGDAGFRARFRREVAAARAVSGAFTAPVIDADPEAAAPWLVTAYLPGLSLQEAVGGYGPLAPGAVRVLGAGLAEALLAVHRAGVVHRDLKPSNVLLTREGPRVIDFGIARAAEASAVTRTGMTVGSPGYMAPEQAEGKETGPAGDVFALGAVLTFAATGAGPFGRGEAHELTYRIVHEPPSLDAVPDAELRELVAACLDKDARRRPAPEEVLERLAAAMPAAPHGTGWLPGPVAAGITERATLPPPPPPTLDAAAAGRRGVLKAGAAGAALLALGGTAALLTVRTVTAAEEGTWSYAPEDGGGFGKGPAVAGGLVLVGKGGSGGMVTALDARTGEKRWSAALPTSAGVQRWEVAGHGGVGLTGGLSRCTAFDLATGKSRWSVSYDRAGDSRPVLGGGLVHIVGTVGERIESGDWLVAYDALTGTERWRFDASERILGNPVVLGGTVFVFAEDGTGYGLDTATGQPRWRRTLAERPQDLWPHVAGDGGFHVLAGDTLHSLDAATGRTRWQARVEAAGHTGSPAVTVAGGRTFVPSGGAVKAYESATGRPLWTFALPAGAGRNREVPMIVPGGGLAFFHIADVLYAVDLASGRLRWSYDRGLRQIYERPVLAAGAVHFAGGSAVHTFDLGTGKLLRKHRSLLATNLATANGVLYWRNLDGAFAIPAAT